MSMILRIEYDVASCKDCPLLGRDGVNYTCMLICSKHLDFLMLDQKRDEECPLMNVENRQKGKWIGIGYDGYADGNPVYDEWECSNCGHEIKTEDTPPYCEMCGAKMEMTENEPLMTNKEVINNMSTEELAKYLFNRGNCQEYCYGICAFQDDCVNPYVKGEGFCIEQICKWLESENEEELR